MQVKGVIRDIGLYIHIPFCQSKCSYCDFISIPNPEAQMVSRYMEALLLEIDHWRNRMGQVSIKTVFIGGGTPSSIEPIWIEKLMHQLAKNFEISKHAEITMEINPGTLSVESANIYKKAGINRVSMGLQSTHDTMLKTIGRIHLYDDFLKSVQLLRSIGIDNINADLMFGLPGQSLEAWRETLEEVIALNLPHLSAYALKVEPGTPMHRWVEKGALKLPNEEVERSMYHLALHFLSASGYPQYEISNFSKPGFQCRHNLIYWENKPYLGIGVAAHSKLFGKRFSNTENFLDYCTHLENDNHAICSVEKIDDDENLFETIILGLRLNKGLDLKAIAEKHHVDLSIRYAAAIEKLIRQELICYTERGIALTDYGRDLSNQVFLAFMDD